MQTLSGNFRNFSSFSTRSNLEDPAVAGWSGGAYIIDPVTVQPTLMSPWIIYGYSITFKGFIHYTPNYSGLLGKLYGGLVRGSYKTGLPFGRGQLLPWQYGVSLPPTPDLLTLLWDGATDDCWPALRTSAPFDAPTGAVRTVSTQLPQPMPLAAGDTLSVGMWLTSSLQDTASITLGVEDASWTVTYDQLNAAPGGFQVPNMAQSA